MKALVFLLMSSVSMPAPTGAEPPEARLTNGELELVVMLPDARSGFYRGVRFDWSGRVAQAICRGHTFFQGVEKVTSSGGTGTAEEFRLPLGYQEAAPGEPFVKIGVGVLERLDAKPYHFAVGYKLVVPGEWTVSRGSDWILFEQELATEFGYAYAYRKRIVMAAGRPAFSVIHELRNTGVKRLDTNTYVHNYLLFDGESVGPDYQVEFPAGVKAMEEAGGAYEVLEKLVRPASEIGEKQSSGVALEAGGNEFIASNRKTGTSLHFTGDHPLASLYFWSWRGAICPEPMIDIRLAAGQNIRWKNSYTLSTQPR